MSKRVFLIVLDSVGIGEMPDAADFGDAGSDTLAGRGGGTRVFPCRTWEGWACFILYGADPAGPGGAEAPAGGSGAGWRSVSRGKDTTTGHWEIAGVLSPDRPLPTFPGGISQGACRIASARETGRGVLCNLPLLRDGGDP